MRRRGLLKVSGAAALAPLLGHAPLTLATQGRPPAAAAATSASELDFERVLGRLEVEAMATTPPRDPPALMGSQRPDGTWPDVRSRCRMASQSAMPRSS